MMQSLPRLACEAIESPESGGGPSATGIVGRECQTSFVHLLGRIAEWRDPYGYYRRGNPTLGSFSKAPS